MTWTAATNANFSAKAVSCCKSNPWKTESFFFFFLAYLLNLSNVNLAALKNPSTTSPASTQDPTTPVATLSSSSSQITFHFIVTEGPSSTQQGFTSGLTTVSPSTATATTELVSSTSTAATSAKTTSIQPDTTTSATLDSGDK